MVRLALNPAILFVFLAAGCSGMLSGSRGVQSTSWSMSNAGEPDLPGITEADVAVGTLDGGAAVVFWTTSGGGLGSRSDPENGNSVYSTTRTMTDGTEFSITCSTPDGVSGTVKIAGQQFDLADGSMFLIATPADTVMVKQVRKQLPGWDPTPKSDLAGGYTATLQEFARANAEIREFFMAANRRETAAEVSDSDTGSESDADASGI